MRLLAAGQAQLKLRAAVAQVETHRHQGQALLLRQPGELGDLRPMQQQLARAPRLMVVPVSLVVGRDVRADEPRLAVLDAGVGLRQVDVSGSDRLDLGPGQHDACLEGVLDGVLEAGSAVDGDRVVGHRSILA